MLEPAEVAITKDAKTLAPCDLKPQVNSPLPRIFLRTGSYPCLNACPALHFLPLSTLYPPAALPAPPSASRHRS